MQLNWMHDHYALSVQTTYKILPGFIFDCTQMWPHIKTFGFCGFCLRGVSFTSSAHCRARKRSEIKADLTLVLKPPKTKQSIGQKMRCWHRRSSDLNYLGWCFGEVEMMAGCCMQWTREASLVKLKRVSLLLDYDRSVILLMFLAVLSWRMKKTGVSNDTASNIFICVFWDKWIWASALCPLPLFLWS